MDDLDMLLQASQRALESNLPEEEKTLGELSSPTEPIEPIDLLAPGTDLHNEVLSRLIARRNASRDRMASFHARWRMAERKAQAYVWLKDYESQLEEDNNKTSRPTKLVSIVVPYIFATINTLTTYMLHTFFGRRPYFPVTARKAESVRAAENMEVMLQYNADKVDMVRRAKQFFDDAFIYGFGVMRGMWTREVRMRTRMVDLSQIGLDVESFAPGMAQQPQRVRQPEVVFEGTDVVNIDPWKFFPDPRVPIGDVAKSGEFVFWQHETSRLTLVAAEAQGQLKHVDAIPELPTTSDGNEAGTSDRALRSMGEASPGLTGLSLGEEKENYFVQLDQGTVNLIPKNWGLGESTFPEKWLFTWGNDAQIIQAEVFEANHGLHPVTVCEPTSFGYGFGQPSMTDYLTPIQDTVSWFFNSRFHNIRAALNNRTVVDPLAVNMKDLTDPEPGGIIRTLPSAMGRDLRTVIEQLPVTDVTHSHIGDAQEVLRLGDGTSGASENLKGLQEPGGRKTATEIRASSEAAASRLAAMAKVFGTAFAQLTEMMSENYQQYLTTEVYAKVTGQRGMAAPVTLDYKSIMGDFNFPIHDGTLPPDKVGLLDIWKELFLGASQNPILSQQLNLVEMFLYIAELGGAKNIKEFVLTPDEQINQLLSSGQIASASIDESGNVVPQTGAPTANMGAI